MTCAEAASDSRNRTSAAASASPDSGASTSKSGDDGATLQLDVEEIDAADSASPRDVSDTLLPQTANDFPALYRCYVCERHFDSVAELKSHVCDSKVTATAGKRFSCRHCQMQFRHRQNLVRHELVHTGMYSR